MQPLAAAAVCRSESDWLVGINSTRAMTAYNSRYGGFNKTPVGRVQTPTLALLAEREKEIATFRTRDLISKCTAILRSKREIIRAAGSTSPSKRTRRQAHARAERIWDRETAEAIVDRCQGKTAAVEEKKKPTKQTPADALRPDHAAARSQRTLRIQRASAPCNSPSRSTSATRP